ncbi:Nop14-like protein [Auriculariales sp. MPI-PUGE-AT-0066]|nr:Nop14-like protein [Auriculariales sp. MPI-PUGE-AT-0066]
MPSQLKALKTELSRAGLSRQSQAGSSKKRKRSNSRGPQDADKDKRESQLQRIHDKFNQFDTKVTKLKHDVAGRKLKGVTGKPTTSRQAAIDLRKNTLLVEYAQRNHAGGIVDRRFGENNPDMTPEERMQERFTKERQRVSKLNMFSLDDDTELTHYGQSLSKMDDFDSSGLALDDDEDDMQMDKDTVGRAHFGGFDNDEEAGDEDDPDRKKSKAEVMAEVIAKSKEHKYMRQMNQERQEAQRHQLDDEFSNIQALLMGGKPDVLAPAPTNDNNDKDYDTLVRELVFDHRSKPSDRTKTEDELAVEEKAKLEKLERSRIRRMRGESDDGDDEEQKRYSKRRKHERGGDDLEDDFMGEDELAGLGAGLAAAGEDEDPEEDAELGDEQSLESGDDDGDGSEASDVFSLKAHGEPSSNLAQPSSARKKVSSKSSKELPFTFPCPSCHSELLDILEDVIESDVPTVIQRIRTLYHPSLGAGNKAKLEVLSAVLLDHVLHVAGTPDYNTTLISALVAHIDQLSHAYPIASAEAFVTKLKLMSKNLTRGLAHGPTSSDAKTWPGSAELTLLRVVSTIWPTSDKTHVVVGPARLLIASYLGLARVRSHADIACGLYLCTLVLQYERLSQRLVPEAVNFLYNSLVHLAPHSLKQASELPGSFPTPDFGQPHCPSMSVGKKAKKLAPRQPDLNIFLNSDKQDDAQIKVDLLACANDLLSRTADLYKSLDGFIELFSPLLTLLSSLQVQYYSPELKKSHDALGDRLTRLLKFAAQSRRPLRLQAHKAIAIPSYVPKFSTNGGSNSTYLRTQDPDRERAEAAKLRREYKAERKGAIKELRKDARFMAEVVHRQQQEKDQGYNERLKKVHAGLEGERAEEKALEREKSKIKNVVGGASSCSSDNLASPIVASAHHILAKVQRALDIMRYIVYIKPSDRVLCEYREQF